MNIALMNLVFQLGTSKHLLRRPLGVPNTSSQGIWRILEDPSKYLKESLELTKISKNSSQGTGRESAS